MKPIRITKRQSDILSILSGDLEYIEIGAQPYTAPSVAYILNLNQDGNTDISTTAVRTTLKLLVEKGLVEVERKQAEVQTGLGEITRELDHYWNIATKKEDEVTAKRWNDDAEERREVVFEKMFS